jgi:hypothetical protein
MRLSTRQWVTCAISLTAAYLVFATAQSTVSSNSDGDSRSLARLQHAPQVLTVGDSFLRLKAYIWRDFMPVGVPDDPIEARAIVADATAMRAII